MPLRLSNLPNFALRCPYQSFPPISQFHTSPSWKSDDTNYYETLGLEPNASAASIKKQFYHLSKLHHPDHNPDDPTASTRFVKISTAYATLGSASKRERYDRDLQRSSSSSVRAGSHSSSSTPFGSRPASGLSKRRTHFRGPPPSFYRSGGWGNQGAKRQAQADAAASAAASSAQSSTNSASFGGGFSTGQNPLGWDNDVPHFDRDGHLRTQEQQEQRRRKRIEEERGQYGRGVGGDVLLRFVIVGGVVALACGLPGLLEKGLPPVKRKDAD